MSKFLVRLVHFVHAPHEDLQVDPDQGKERGSEVDFALYVHGHVHADQALISQEVGTLATESQGRIDLL